MGFFIVWLVLSLIVGGIGSDRKIGFWGAFFCSLLLSPLIGFIVALTSKTLNQEALEKQMVQNQINTLQKIQQTEETNNQAIYIAAELEKLSKLKTEGVLSDEDFEKAKAKILS